MAQLIVTSSSPREDGTFKVIGTIDGHEFVIYARDNADVERQALAHLAAKTSQSGKVISTAPRPITEPVPLPPTPEELALQAWLVLLANYKRTAAAFKFGDGRTTQVHVDAALTALRASYIDAYAIYLVGVF